MRVVQFIKRGWTGLEWAGRGQITLLLMFRHLLIGSMSEQTQITSRYSCSQLFGYRSRSEKLLEEDDVTCVSFDQSGRMLAVGDKSGRLIVFQNQETIQPTQEYDYHFEFEAHKQQYDTLKNLFIPEKISHIHWMRPQGQYQRLLTTSAHSIHRWKVNQQTPRRIVRRASIQLELPHFQDEEPSVCVSLRGSFSDRTFSPINSMGLTPDEQYLYTSHAHSLLLWNLEDSRQPFILNHLPEGDSLSTGEKITCSHLHPRSQSLLAYGTSKGRLNVLDSRVSSTNPSLLNFRVERSEGNYIDDIIRQYTGVRFLSDGKRMVTRDLLSIKVWDMCYNREPLLTIPVDDTIKKHVVELFEADSLQDSFSITEASSNIVTGNYGDCFQVIDPSTGDNVQYELDYGQETNVRRVGSGKKVNPFSCSNRVRGHDYNPSTGQLAVSTNSCFFIFSQEPS